MELLQLTDKQIRTIYLERIKKDFAPDEIKPLSRIRKALAEGNYACSVWCRKAIYARYGF